MEALEESTVPIVEGPKPIAVSISTNDVQCLYACHTSPDAYNQLILAKLKDAGAPVEGILRLKLAHGAVAKVKDNPVEPSDEFTYMWLPENYVLAIASAKQVVQ